MRRLQLAALAISSTVSVSIYAEHIDRAPLGPEVTDRIQSEIRRAPPSAVTRRAQGHLSDLEKRLHEIERTGASQQRPVPAALRMEALKRLHDEAIQRIVEQEGVTAAKGWGEGSKRLERLRRQVDERFARLGRLAQRFEDVHGRRDKGAARELARALGELKAPEHAGVEPVPTFTVGSPVPPARQLKSPPPRYMTWHRELPLLAAAEGEVLLTVLDPVPPALDCGQTAADLDKTALDANVTAEIAALAQSLDYSPTRILDYVTNQIAFEPYWGSLKGAQGTLHSKSGGATDQASLLVALLRQSNIPARYVRGTIDVRDARAPRWLGAKTFRAAANILAIGGNPRALTVLDASNNPVGMEFAHVWVEACVPYANYRGTRADVSGYRWIPMDSSFRDRTFQAGIGQTTAFDYAGYMARRTNDLPSERYADQVEAAIKSVGPNFANNTVQDVPYKGKLVARPLDILPSSLPYRVLSFDAWGASMTAETALLPDDHRYKLSIGPADAAGAPLMSAVVRSMPEIVLQRITLGWKGATPGDQSALDAWKSQPLSALPNCSLNVVPEIKAEGAVLASGTGAVGLCTNSNRLQMRVTLDDPSYAVHPLVINEVNYTNIGAANVHALQAHARQTSDRLLNERAARLLNAVRTNPPNSNTDEVLGEFLHLTGLKYLRYISDAHKYVAGLDGGSGESGIHLGLASSQMRVEYLFDLPFAVSRTGFLVDFPGGQFNSIDLSTGQPVWKTFILSGYTGSFLESYVWQENAKMDAVSTVRGVQFARESGIEVLVLNSSNWASESGKLTSNSDSSLNYSSSDVSNLNSSYIGAGYTLTIPRSLIQYGDWKGAVYIAEKDGTANPANPTASASFVISRYAGGETTGSSFGLEDLFSFFTDLIGRGLAALGITNDANQGQTSVLTSSSAIGTGITPQSTLGGDPVNVVNGNMYHVERDISIRGRGLPIVFERSYNSRSPKDGPLGFGWTHSFNHSLQFRDDNLDGAVNAADSDNITSSVIWTDGTGSDKFIAITGATSTGVPSTATFATPKGFFFQMARQTDGTYTLREKNGLTYRFENVAGAVNQKAKLLSISDRNGNGLTLSYTGQNLASVTDPLNRALTLTYNGSNRITEIRDWTSRSFQYGYDASGNLTSFKNPRAVAGQQPAVTYEYYADSSVDSTGQSSPLNRAMKKYTLPRGNGMTFEYYANGRVLKHYNTLGETNTFTYNEFRRETVQVNERGNTRRFFFDPNGNATSIVEENGAERSYTYDCAEPGNPANCANPFNRLSKRDPLGYATGYQYDAQGNVTQITVPSGSTIEFSYFDAFNQPGKTKDVRGNYTLSKYDAQGNLLQVIKLKNGFGAAIDPTTYVPAPSQVVAWIINTYDASGNLTSTKRVKDFSAQTGPVVSYTYDSQGLNLLSMTRTGILGNGTSGSETSPSLVYDSLGRPTTGLRADWYPVQYSYDAVDRVTQATDNNQNLRNYLYDANGNAIGDQIVNAGNITDNMSYSFDLSDRRTQSVNSGGYATNFEFDAAGNVMKVTNPDGYNVSFEYDAANHVVRAQNERGDSVVKDLDIDGKPRLVVDPNGNAVAYSYYGPEREGRVKRVTQPVITGFSSGRATEYDYDAAGNVVRITNVPATPSAGSAPAPREALSFYDELNRLVRSAGPSYVDTVAGSSTNGTTIRPVTTYVYDPLGNLTTVAVGKTDASGTNTAADVVTTQMTYEYDDFRRQLRRTNAIGKFWVSRYDTNGNLIQSTDARNQSIYHTYLYGGRLQCTSKVAPNTTCVSNSNLLKNYVRNPLGLITQAYSPEVTYDYTYDAAKRMKTARDGRGSKTLTYDWSNGNRLNRMVDGEGKETNYLYDAVGRLGGIWTPSGEYISFDWDKAGRLRQKWYPNGASTGYTYNEDNSVFKVENVALPSQISTHTYTYDGFGSRVTRRDEVNGYDLRWRFTYDGRGQLAAQYVSYNIDQFGNPGSQQPEVLQTSYAYDPLGNIRRQVFVDGSRIDDTVDAANQLTLRSFFTGGGAPDGTQVWSHDDNGNVTTRDFGGGNIVTYSYDVLNRLDTAVRAGSYNQGYGYDDQGRRVRKTISGTPNYYLYDGDNLYAEYGSSWSIAPGRTTYGPGTDQPLVRDTGIASERRYYHADAQGSVGALTDASRTVTWINMYDAWGADFFGASGPGPLQRYTGREGDETSLHYYRARYYFPYAPRFLQPDPIGYAGGQINLYAYVGNSPMNSTDPSGLIAAPTSKVFNPNALTGQQDYTSGGDGAGGLSSGSQNLQVADAGKTYNNGIVCDMCHPADGPTGPTPATANAQEKAADPKLDAISGAPFIYDVINIPGAARTVAAGIGVFGMRLLGSESRALLPMTDAAFMYGTVRNVAGYDLAGNAGAVGSTYNVNVWGLYATENSQGLTALTNALRAEARSAGATQISITGNAVINPAIANMNPAVAARFGFSFEQINQTTILLRGPVVP